mgnify:CR=1 FL=1
MIYPSLVLLFNLSKNKEGDIGVSDVFGAFNQTAEFPASLLWG